MPIQEETDRVFHSINRIIDENVRNGVFTHAVVLYGSLKENKPLFSCRFLPQNRDIFDLASITKAVVTTPLVFRSLEKRGLSLEASVERWVGNKIAALLHPRLRAIKVRSLLRHDSGLPAWRNFWVCYLGNQHEKDLQDPKKIRERIIEGLNRAASHLDLEKQRPVYSDIGFILLGFCLAEESGQTLSDLFKEFLRDDLFLEERKLELSFGVEHTILHRAVPTSFCSLRGRELLGEVHDENAASLGGVQGHAGLFGTAEALAEYLHVFSKSNVGLNVLQANGKAIMMPPGEPPNESLMGWRQGADPSSFPFAAGDAMGHMGFTGVAFWVCPTAQDYAILLTNRVRSGRTRPGIASFRRDVLSALSELRSGKTK